MLLTVLTFTIASGSGAGAGAGSTSSTVDALNNLASTINNHDKTVVLQAQKTAELTAKTLQDMVYSPYMFNFSRAVLEAGSDALTVL